MPLKPTPWMRRDEDFPFPLRPKRWNTLGREFYTLREARDFLDAIHRRLNDSITGTDTGESEFPH